MSLVLGIDQSYTSAGICLMNLDGVPLEMYTIKTSETDGDKFARANIISKRILSIIETHKPVCVGLEGLAFSKIGDATRDLAGLQYVIITTLRYQGNFSTIALPSPNEVKKFATGKGNADKAMMAEALPADVRKRIDESNYRKTTGLYDITDAYWIAKYSIEYYQKRILDAK